MHFVGQIDDPAKLSIIFNAARALVFPTLHEGFGLPALEAMRCGTPGSVGVATPQCMQNCASIGSGVLQAGQERSLVFRVFPGAGELLYRTVK